MRIDRAWRVSQRTERGACASTALSCAPTSPSPPNRGTDDAAAARHVGIIERSASTNGSGATPSATHLDSGLTGSTPYGWLPTSIVRHGPSGRTLDACSDRARATSWPSVVVACMLSKKYWNVACHSTACIAAMAGSVTSSPPATALNTSPSTPSAAANRARSLPAAAGTPVAPLGDGVRSAGVLFVGVPGSSRPTPSRWVCSATNRSSAALPEAAACASRTPKTTSRVSADAVGIGSC